MKHPSPIVGVNLGVRNWDTTIIMVLNQYRRSFTDKLGYSNSDISTRMLIFLHSHVRVRCITLPSLIVAVNLGGRRWDSMINMVLNYPRWAFSNILWFSNHDITTRMFIICNYNVAERRTKPPSRIVAVNLGGMRWDSAIITVLNNFYYVISQ